MIDESVASNRQAAVEGYALLRDCSDPLLHGLIRGLEEAHLATLDTLTAQADLLTTLDLNFRAINERAGL